MKTFRDFLAESDNGLVVKKQKHSGDDDNASAKHDVYHNGKHIESLYHHPNDGEAGPRWEVMRPHDNKAWEDDYGDHHHYRTGNTLHSTKARALEYVKAKHKIDGYTGDSIHQH